MAKVAPIEHVEFQESIAGSKGRRSPIASTRSGSPDDLSQGASWCFSVRQGVRTFFYRRGMYDSRWAMGIRKCLRGRAFSFLSMTSLFLALFLREVLAIIQVPTNTESDIILTVVFVVYLLEFLSLALTDMSYPFGCFFWIDLVGTASMAFDISYMAGEDATEPYRVSLASGSTSGDQATFARATRATRLVARAGRIIRVLKILRFLPLLFNSHHQQGSQVKMARAMSNQLTNFLSTRVGFLTTCIAIVVPFAGLLLYPEVDDSMCVWAQVLNQNAMAFHEALAGQNDTRRALERQRLLSEVQRCCDFYSTIAYGPFDMQYGEVTGDTFVPRPDDLDIKLPSAMFTKPRRKSSIHIINEDFMQMSFDLSTAEQGEAAASVGLIFFMIFVMCGFGFLMSGSISVIALQPLERILAVVRQCTTQIWAYTNELEDTDSDNNSDEGDYGVMEHYCELMLLEKVVKRLALIAKLATDQGPELTESMTEHEILELNWKLVSVGAQAPQPTSPSHMHLKAPVQINRVPTMSVLLSADLINILNTAEFNPLDLSKEMNIAVAAYIMSSAEGSIVWVETHVKERQLLTFLSMLESKYLPNPFHNFAHAIDVEYSVMRYMQLTEAHSFLSEVAQFWLLVAAVAHDVGHVGVNNQYLIELAHDLAVRYNDRSPLENMHCARLFQITSNSEANIFSCVSKDEFKEMRKGIISVILHTDVTKHNEIIKDMGLLYQMNSEAFDDMEPGLAVAQSSANVQLVLNSFLHGADVGNPMKPWALCQRYAYLCLDEFFAQGDLEKAAGIPVQMLNDRDKVNRPNSQIGFIEFVIAPLVTAMVHLFPNLDSLAMHLGENIQRWAEVWQEECSPSPDAVSKVEARVQKVAATCQRLMRE